MDDRLITALIAATVSLVVSLATYLSTRKKIASEKERQERELQRKLTEKLYDIRMEHYPKAFSITQRILGGRIFREGIPGNECLMIGKELEAWASQEATFSMSKSSLKAFYELRTVLKEAPGSERDIPKELKDRIFKAKNKFRGALVRDVELLFTEDRKHAEQDNQGDADKRRR